MSSDYQIATDQLLKAIVAGETEVSNREQLGPMVPIRLFQVVRLMAVGRELENVVGGGARALVYRSGQAVGEALGGALAPQAAGDLDAYVDMLAGVSRALGIGVLVPARVDLDAGELSLRVDECVSCAGIGGVSAPICHFEAGMVGGIVRAFVGRGTRAVESKCNAIGDNTCQVDVAVIG